MESEDTFIAAYLLNCGVKIKTVPPEQPYDDVLDGIARFIGSNFADVECVYGQIKKHMNNGGAFRLSLHAEPQAAISASTQLCNRLHAIAFLESYKYFNSPRYLLTARTTRLPKALNFLSGGWLERYVRCVVTDAVSARMETRPVRFSQLSNAQVTLPNGDDFEIDYMARINDELIWIEAKTGDYQRHVVKYARMARLLALDFNSTFMVLSEIGPEHADALSGLFDMQVVSVNRFADRMQERIEAILSMPS